MKTTLDLNDQLLADAKALAAQGARGEGRFIAGGTNLLDLMKLGIERPLHARRAVPVDVRPAEHVRAQRSVHGRGPVEPDPGAQARTVAAACLDLHTALVRAQLQHLDD